MFLLVVSIKISNMKLHEIGKYNLFNFITYLVYKYNIPSLLSFIDTTISSLFYNVSIIVLYFISLCILQYLSHNFPCVGVTLPNSVILGIYLFIFFGKYINNILR